MKNNLTIIILCGGKGTRIRSSIGNIPKILAPIQRNYFFEYLLTWIDFSFENVNYEIILATGHLHNEVADFCLKKNLNVKFSREFESLGTLGASYKASLISENENLLIMNGDTLIDLNLADPLVNFGKLNKPLLITQRCIANSLNAFYKIDVSTNSLIFNAKNPDLISMGILFVDKTFLLEAYIKTIKSKIKKPMIDNDLIADNKCKAYEISKDRIFIDIGTEENYKKAQYLIPKFFKTKF